ncbi:unnamed protein product [Closterium sp. NIES-54]
MASELTPNALEILNSGATDGNFILQVFDSRQVGSASVPPAQERYRLMLSDGRWHQWAMIASQMNELMRTSVKKGSIINLTECVTNTVHGKKIVIILKMEVVKTDAAIIGDPQPFPADGQAPPLRPQPSSTPASTLTNNSAAPPPQHQPLPQSNAAPNPMAQHDPPGAAHPSNAAQPVPPNPYSAGGFGQQQQQQQKQSQYSGVSGPPGGGSAASHGGGFAGGPGTGGGGGYGGGGGAAPPPSYSARGPVARNEAHARVVPIDSLNPYLGKWTIKARVTSKGDIRRYNNARGEGKVFSFDLLDAEGGEIRVTCFNREVDSFFDKIQKGQVYMLSKGSLKPAQRMYNHLRSDWEIMLDASSSLDLCPDDGAIGAIQYDFRTIADVAGMENNSVADVVGVVVSVGASSSIMRRNGTETMKRTCMIRDQSGRQTELTMWGGFCSAEGQQLQGMGSSAAVDVSIARGVIQARCCPQMNSLPPPPPPSPPFPAVRYQELVEAGQHPVLAIKAGRVSDFSGKSLGTISSTQLAINPDIPQAKELASWYTAGGGASMPVQVISSEFGVAGGGGTGREPRKLIAAIKDEGLGLGGKVDWISVRGTVSYFRADNCYYPACPLMTAEGRQCQKKVVQDSNGDGWYCEKCGRATPTCDFRYILSFQLQDHTGMTWLSAFQEVSEEMLKTPASEINRWREENDLRAGEVFANAQWSQWVVKLKVREETWQDEAKVKCTVVKAEPVNYAAESRVLLDYIGRLQRGEPLTAPVPASPGLSAGVGGMQSRLIITEMVLENFKSYAGVQRVGPFHKCFSSVVGPNGSGKSNVIDAMLFVFGKRAKQLRLNKVSELIHNSTDHQNLESARVSVHFKEIVDLDDEKYESVPGSEFVISRTAYRNNTSKYHVDDHASTFTEVTRLLKAKGVDLDNNRFLILQGEVEQIAMMKPKAQGPHDEGLLEYLEDIIGSNQYIEQIDAGAKQLEELNERRVGLVERVKHAEKDKDTLEEAKRAAEAYMVKEAQCAQWGMVGRALALRESQGKAGALGTKVAELESTLTAEKEKCAGLREELQVKTDACEKCNTEYEALCGELEVARADFKEYERKDVKMREDLKHCKARLKKLADKIAKDTAKVEEVEKAAAAAETAIPELEKKAASLTPRLAEAEKKLESIQEHVRVEVEQQQQQLGPLQEQLAPWEEKASAAKAKADVTRTKLSLIRDKHAAAEKQLEADKQQHLVRDMSEKVSTPEGVPRLFDLVQVQDARLLPAFWFALRNTLVAASLDQASRIAYGADARFRRVVTLAGEMFESSGTMAGGGGRPRGGRMGSSLKAAAAAAGGGVTREMVEEAEREVAAVVARLERVREERRAAVARREEAERVLKRLGMDIPKVQMEIESLAAQVGELQQRVEGLQAVAVESAEEERLMGALQQQLAGEEGEEARIHEEMAPLVAAVARVQQAIADAGREALGEQKDHVAAIQKAIDEAQTGINQSRVTVASSSRSLEKLRKAVGEAEEERARAEEERARKKEEMNAVMQEAFAVNDNYERIRQLVEGKKEEYGSMKKEFLAIKAQLDKMRTGEVDVELKLEDAKKALRTSQETARLQREKLRALGAQLRQHIAQMQAEGIAEEDVEAAGLPWDLREGEGEIQGRARPAAAGAAERGGGEGEDEEMEDDEGAEHREGGVGEVGAADGGDGELERLLARLCGNLVRAVTSREEAAAGEQRLRAELEALKGNLNLSSIAEYHKKEAVYSQRLGELEAVTAERDSVRQAQEEVKRRRLDEFMAGFDTITMRLKEMYQMITLGGDAELELVDSLDPFSEGIVFSVRPPKKSWKNICNLSGGEKTLSSLALVFALHHYKPTPLYVMDEIDAALDFKNVSIVAHYIKERTKNAQFVIISLRNNMFELADHLVGIYKTHNCTKSITINPRSFAVSAAPTAAT